MYLDVAGEPVSILALAGLGILVGIVAGMFGVGGGFVLTPLLATVLGVPLPIAVGSGLCQMVGTATVSVLRHQRLGQGELRFDWLMLLPSIVGAFAGAKTVEVLAGAGNVELWGTTLPWVVLVLYGAYAVFLLGSGGALVKRASTRVEALSYVRRGPLARIPLPPYVDFPRVPLSRVSAIAVAYVGLGLGFLSGLLGVGGGIALMPALLFGFGFPLRQAAGTGIVVLLVTSASGTVFHAYQGNVHLGLAMVLAVGASLSAQVGALATAKLPPRLLRTGLSWLILGTLVTIVYDFATQFW